jgi:hypothetical protein
MESAGMSSGHEPGADGERPRMSIAEALRPISVQVAKKRWADERCVAGLVRAIDDLLRPQATLCSFGIDRLSAAAIRERLAACRW